MRWLWISVAFASALGCFDPLYEVQAGATWSACCRDGEIDTCSCTDANTCSFEIQACAQGRCVVEGSCNGGAGGSSGTGGGSSASGGGSSGGSGGEGGGVSDGGTSADAGVPSDAGYVHPDAGSGGGAGGGGQNGTGGGGGTGGGITTSEDAGSAGPYVLCCPNQILTSCLCPGTGCAATVFTACGHGTCVPSAGAHCSD